MRLVRGTVYITVLNKVYPFLCFFIFNELMLMINVIFAENVVLLHISNISGQCKQRHV